VHASASPLINYGLMLLHKLGPYTLSMVMGSLALPPTEVAAGCLVQIICAGLGLHIAVGADGLVRDPAAKKEGKKGGGGG
jgi:hypothetical protein